jgi:hypothetical protein
MGPLGVAPVTFYGDLRQLVETRAGLVGLSIVSEG